jgi:hypothetical protein
VIPCWPVSPVSDDTADRQDRSPPAKTRRGFLDPQLVRAFAFWTTAVCISVAVMASLLAIWQFTGTDVLWRTVATCAVIGAGTLAFSLVNGFFGGRD